MGYARKVGWVTAGLVIGAGACYCIYRLTRGRKQNKEKMAEGGSGDVDDVGDCPGARYNDWSDDDDDNSENKVFETVSLCSDSLFQRAVSILRTSYLDSASEHGFQYSQVTLVKNDIFLNEYKTFYQEKKASDYTQEELEETCGFLLFETENQVYTFPNTQTIFRQDLGIMGSLVML